MNKHNINKAWGNFVNTNISFSNSTICQINLSHEIMQSNADTKTKHLQHAVTIANAVKQQLCLN